MIRPPRFATWLLARRLGPPWCEYVLGDLEEEFAERARVSPRGATRWFWGQALRCAFFPPPARRDIRPPGDPFMQTLASDVRFACRALRRTPSFAMTVIAVLALGIGANTAIFSIVDAVLLRPLPFPGSDALVRIFHVPPQATFPGLKTFSVSPANFYDWQQSATSFDRMAIYTTRGFPLTGTGTPQTVIGGAVGAGFFDIVRAAPAMGRVFRDDEDAPGRGHVVILSDAFWKSRFGSARDVVGRSITLAGETYTIVGVMPASFSVKAWGATSADLWVPLALPADERAVRDNHNDQVIARLKPGVTVAQADGEMAAISRRLETEYPQADAGWGATVIPLRELIVGDVRLTLLVLLAAVALVLLIACANVGNLLFTRSLARRKEIAIRAALGAARRRVFQQLIVEALLLALAGGALGLAIAHLALQAGAALLATQIPRADEIALDVNVLLFVGAVSLFTGLAAGAITAIRAGRADLNDALKEGGRGDSAVGIRTRRALIVGEVALSVMLLVGAGVMLRTLVNLRHVDAGFDPENVLTMQVALPSARYHSADQLFNAADRVVERLAALPGVKAAGAVDDLPAEGGSVQPVVLEGHAELLPKDQPTVNVRLIRPGYLATMRIPLVAGRALKESDDNVMLVSRAAAKLLWGTEDPIGRRARLPLESKAVMFRVIGVVGDVKQSDLTQPIDPTIYAVSRAPLTEALSHGSRGTFTLTLAIRTAGEPTSLAQAATAAIHDVDPEMPVDGVKTMNAILDQTTTSQRLSAVLLAVFAGVALVLASIGIYSVLAYIVRGRSREIGIRTALGARTSDVVRMVVLEGLAPAGVGIACGVAGALAAGKLLSTLVFGVSATDPLTLAVVAGSLAAVALLASLIPAYRASRVDPVTVLRG